MAEPDVRVLGYVGYTDDRLIVNGQVQIGEKDGQPVYKDFRAQGWVTATTHHRDSPEGKERKMTKAELDAYLRRLLTDVAGVTLAGAETVDLHVSPTLDTPIEPPPAPQPAPEPPAQE